MTTQRGRKPKPKGTTKIAYGTRLEPIVIDYLKQSDNAAELIECLVKRSAAFREFKKGIDQ